MAGEIDVTIVGHVAKLMFQGDRIALCCADLRTALAILKVPTPNMKLLGKLLLFSEISLFAQVGKRKPLEIFPKPGRVARWLSPQIRDMMSNS